MAKDAHLEIGLRWRSQDDSFDVSLDYDRPEIVEDRRELGTDPVAIDTGSLAALVTRDTAYGRALADMLFASPPVLRFYTKAKLDAEEGDLRLHLRLLVDPNAPLRYHMVRWELLADPEDRQPVALKRWLLLSRFLSSSNWRRVAPPIKHELRALVAIAAPAGLDRYGLPDVGVERERERVREAMGGLRVTELVSGGGTRVTIGAIVEALDEGVDLLYLVCHGRFHGDEPLLYLEDDDGNVAVSEGGRLVRAVSELERRPMIAVLCSCQSAGTGHHGSAGDRGSLAALGPRMAAAGVAAVIAMQDDITVETASRFFPAFFASLRKDGVVDHAMAVARARVADQRDWWVPVLFSRLKRGHSWYRSEFSSSETAPWSALVRQVQAGHCTPIVGPGPSGRLLGSRQDIARRWVERWQMPIAAHNLGDLAKVAQYLKVSTAPGMLVSELRTCLVNEFRERWQDVVSDDLLASGDLDKMFEVAGAWLRDQPGDPYSSLAELPVPVYITTGWSSLLEAALEAAGRRPTVRSFDWHVGREQRRASRLPVVDVDTPLVYHLFGHFGDEDSLVLSEDDYFQWLTAWIHKRESVPTPVGTALTRRSLLFLGYNLDDWDFRMLFQAIKSFEGSEQLKRNVHVGVQLNPESQMIEPEAAKDYLESFFGIDKVSIYWGETERFLCELRRRVENER